MNFQANLSKSPSLFNRGMATAFAVSLLLAACGSGGSNASITSTNTTNTNTTNTTSTSDTTAAAGTSGGAAPAPSQTPTPTPTPTPTSTSTPVATAAECPIGDYKSAMVSAINSMRASAQVCGGVSYPAARALVWNSQLESAAAFHSNDMAVNNYFDHPGTDGQRIGARTTAAGYSYSKVGENIAAGQTTSSQAVGDWLLSSSHCANIMTASFVNIGTSCKYNPSSTYLFYWTLVMAYR